MSEEVFEAHAADVIAARTRIPAEFVVETDELIGLRPCIEALRDGHVELVLPGEEGADANAVVRVPAIGAHDGLAEGRAATLVAVHAAAQRVAHLPVVVV